MLKLSALKYTRSIFIINNNTNTSQQIHTQIHKYISTYSWTPQFSRAPTGMSLLVLTFLKAITSAIVVASIYRNIDTAACMFPFYSCFHISFFYQSDFEVHLCAI